jgi:branched-chain amino acid transport system ATP-binding protein
VNAPGLLRNEGPVLSVEDITVYYGPIRALDRVSLHVVPGEIVCLVGSNGAGKSTTLKTISGLLKPREGIVRLNGREISGLKPHQIVMQGVVHVPEGRRIFGRLTVMENLELGAFSIKGPQKIKENSARVFELFPRLKERRNQLAGTLSGGEQQMLAMGRALMTDPKVLLLDEPSMGLAPVLVDDIFETISRLHRRGTTILLVEQNARMALEVSDRGYVLESGKILFEDRAENLRKNEQVRKAYMGEWN